MSMLRYDFALKSALINVSGAAQLLKAYSSAAHGTTETGNKPDTSTSDYFSREGSSFLRGYCQFITATGTNVTAVKVRLRGFGPTTNTKIPTLIPIVKGDDVSSPLLYATELQWSVSDGSTANVSFWTDRHAGFGCYDFQLIAVAGGGAVQAGDSAYLDIHL